MWEGNLMLQYLKILLDGRRQNMDERGASAVEYGLLVGLIAAAVILAVTAFGGAISTLFTDTASTVNGN
jgi:pilus assembly protein Flp/PilA